MVIVNYNGMPYGNSTIRQAACCSRSVSRTGINPRFKYYFEGQRYVFRLNQPQSVPEELADLLMEETYTEHGEEKQGFSIVEN